MAKSIQVAGLCDVQIAVGSAGSGTLTSIGYTRNGAHVTHQSYTSPVPTDENGGDEGPPVDIQVFGESAHIRLELTKWDKTQIDLIRSRTRAGTAGVPIAAGTLMIQGDNYFRLLLKSPVNPLNFPCVVFQEPVEINSGTKFSTVVISGTAYKHPVSGKLYDETTT